MKLVAKITEETTIADVLDNLTDWEKYLIGVLKNMGEFKKQNQLHNAFVAIGTTGGGKAPHYRIFPSNDSLDEMFYFTAYHGRSHAQLKLGPKELQDENWSNRKISYAEVRAILGQRRGFKPKQTG